MADTVWHGEALQGLARRSRTRLGVAGVARPSEAWHGIAKRCGSRLVVARLGRAGRRLRTARSTAPFPFVVACGHAEDRHCRQKSTKYRLASRESYRCDHS